MTVETKINEKLRCFSPIHMDVVNESHMHGVPDGSESHFNVTIVSEQFEGKMLLARHRMVNKVLVDELTRAIHALALHTMTPDEWFEIAGQTPDSPLCLGGSKERA